MLHSFTARVRGAALRHGPGTALALATIASNVHGHEAPVCVNDAAAARSTAAFLDDALAVLRSSGHAPADYRLELRFDDPLAVAGTGSPRAVQAVFEPLDGERGYPVAVSRLDPCVVSWVWRPGRWTPWQREVLERARALAGTAWDGARLADARVTETSDHVGVRLASVEGRELRIVLRKLDLSAVDRPPGVQGD